MHINCESAALWHNGPKSMSYWELSLTGSPVDAQPVRKTAQIRNP